MLRDILNGSSSYPAVFKPVEVKKPGGGRYMLVDGGVSMCSPSILAIAAARKRFPNAKIKVMVLDDGEPPVLTHKGGSFNWGEAQWGNKLNALNVSVTAVDALNMELGAMFAESKSPDELVYKAFLPKLPKKFSSICINYPFKNSSISSFLFSANSVAYERMTPAEFSEVAYIDGNFFGSFGRKALYTSSSGLFDSANIAPSSILRASTAVTDTFNALSLFPH